MRRKAGWAVGVELKHAEYHLGSLSSALETASLLQDGKGAEGQGDREWVFSPPPLPCTGENGDHFLI